MSLFKLTTCVTHSCGCSSSKEQLLCNTLEYIWSPQIKTKTMQCCLLLLMEVIFETDAPLGNCLICLEKCDLIFCKKKLGVASSRSPLL